MGRSLAPVAESSASSSSSDQPGNPVASFDAGPFHYAVERRSGSLFHKESRRDENGRVVAEVENEVGYALGSGTRGVSYLVEHDGRLFQSPIAWYEQKRKWDPSPGYQFRNQHFDRAIEPQCLFCHANHVQPVALTVNRYEAPLFQGYSVGCERCHGPGALHVREQELTGDRDLTIVNPRHLEPALREAVCEQCHLQGDYRLERPGYRAFDYRPGLPLSTFLSILNRTGKGGNRAVGHVEQMHRSKCFRASQGEMGCISCHDPHEVPATEEKTSYYRRRCLACHERRPCGLPVAERLARNRDDDCIACHMPMTSNTDIVHNATTDHRVLRDPHDPRPALEEPKASGLPLELVHGDQVDPAERSSMSRELAIGLAYEARRLTEPRQRTRLAWTALGLLERALTQRPEDLVALRARAQALVVSGRTREGVSVYDAILKLAPDYEQALDERVSLALELEDARSGLAPARRAVEVNPWSAEFHERLAHLEIQNGHWTEAMRETAGALRLNPFLTYARQFRIQCLLRDRELGRAAEELETLITLDPSRRETWRLWFARERQGRGISLSKETTR